MNCIITDCRSSRIARGMCKKHYVRWYRYGDPMVVKKFVQPTGENAYAFKHGHWDHPLYKTWRNMISRCENPNDHAYHNYGGRGIAVCSRWHDIAKFIADMGDRPKGLILERINNDGDYSPDNCCWASYTEQARNRRNVKLTMVLVEEIRAIPRKAKNGKGPGASRKDIAARYGVSVATIKKVLSGEHWA